MTPRAKQLARLAGTLTIIVLIAVAGVLYLMPTPDSTVESTEERESAEVPAAPAHGSATITRGPIDQMGSLSEAQVAAVLDTENDTLMPCYTEALGETSDLGGTTTVNLMIGRDGAVSAAFHIGATFENQPFEECLIDVFEGWRFPTAESGVTRLLVPYSSDP